MSTILMYHYIGNPPSPNDPHAGLHVSLDEFRLQVAAIRRLGLSTVSPEEYDAGLDTGRLDGTVWITFDDGRRDNYEAAFPVLRDAGLRATFFVIAGKSLAGDPDYVTIDMMREMLAAGMSIGSHTMTHPRLARLHGRELDEEVAGSRRRLEDALGVEITSLCYPYGNFGHHVVEAARRAGYRLAVSTIRDNRNTAADRWHLCRAMVQPGRTGWRFRHIFSSVYHYIHAHKNRERWRKKS